ncbi:uncharacterized protein LOC102803497 [Saccoglossus kowalevskii]|uniref:Zinc finger protein 569-like n=1 Tax=Saccoglossus kowalevskii TaxID=10224 RepID=A0ABM0MC77_SACKO|nr:PREDICTED: zinc finger protein 569-like [Saccoglossus kowalevskii]
MSSMDAKKDGLFSCDQCDVTYSTRHKVQLHKWLTHCEREEDEPDKYNCYQCHSIFLDQLSLHSHHCVNDKTQNEGHDEYKVSNQGQSQFNETVGTNYEEDNMKQKQNDLNNNSKHALNTSVTSLKSECTYDDNDFSNSESASKLKISPHLLKTKTTDALKFTPGRNPSPAYGKREPSDISSVVLAPRVHTRGRTGEVHERTLTCSHCDRKFFNKCNLVRHINAKHSNSSINFPHKQQQFPCKFCTKVLLSKNGLVLHNKFKHPEICRAIIKRGSTADKQSIVKRCMKKKEWNKHEIKCVDTSRIRRKHSTCKQTNRKLPPGKAISCDRCPRTFASMRHLGIHMRSHATKKWFQCDKCIRKYCNPGSYIKHLKDGHIGEASLCKSKEISKARMQPKTDGESYMYKKKDASKHVNGNGKATQIFDKKRHDSSEIRRSPKDRKMSKSSFSRDNNSKLQKKMIKCKFCYQTFSGRGALYRHKLNSHRGDTEDPSIASSSYTSNDQEYSLKNIKGTKMLKPPKQKFKCESTNQPSRIYKASLKTSTQSPIRSQPLKDSREASSSIKTKLRNAVLPVVKVTPVVPLKSNDDETSLESGDVFKCGHCAKVFQSRWSLCCHMQIMHIERKYKCGKCDFASMYPSNLNEHNKIKH